MKKFALLTALATLGLLGFSATNVLADDGVATNILKVKFVALIQTNDVVHGDTDTARAMKIKFTTKDILGLLAEEFDTTLPDGAQLAEVDGDISILNKDGSLFLDISTNADDDSYELYFGSEGDSVSVGKDTETDTKESEHYTDYEYSFLHLSADDIHLRFDGMGKEHYTSSYNDSTGAYKESDSMSLPGAGYVDVDGYDFVLTGEITGHGKESGIDL